MIFNLDSGTPLYDLIITGVPNVTVTITDGKKSYTRVTGSDGTVVFSKLKKGKWTVTATDGSVTASYEVVIGKDSSNMLNINAIPEFTYSGSYEVVDDAGKAITFSLKNWKIRFLTGGTLTFNRLNGAADGIDVFCVGGGGNGGSGGSDHRTYEGGGGGGGHTITQKGVSVTTTVYTITIAGACGTTSAFGVSASGGESGTADIAYANPKTGGYGGAGGSGGGAMRMPGGSDGSYGSTFVSGGAVGDYYGGAGQGYSTREFGESTGTLYAGGGGGGMYQQTGAAGGAGGGGNGGGELGSTGALMPGVNGVDNTGGGGGGCGWAIATSSPPGSGGSGIVVIRNKR